MADQLFFLTPEGGEFHIFSTTETRRLLWPWKRAFVEDHLTPEMMLAAGGTIAPWFASITFGGRDLRTAYIGSLKGTRIPISDPRFRGCRWSTGGNQGVSDPCWRPLVISNEFLMHMARTTAEDCRKII